MKACRGGREGILQADGEGDVSELPELSSIRDKRRVAAIKAYPAVLQAWDIPDDESDGRTIRFEFWFGEKKLAELNKQSAKLFSRFVMDTLNNLAHADTKMDTAKGDSLVSA